VTDSNSSIVVNNDGNGNVTVNYNYEGEKPDEPDGGVSAVVVTPSGPPPDQIAREIVQKVRRYERERGHRRTM
jgi:hypothetical protein